MSEKQIISLANYIKSMFWRKIKSTLPKNYPNLCIKPSPLRMQQDMFGTKTQKYKYFSIRDILGFYAAIQIMFGTVFCSLGGSYWLINWWTVLPSSDSCYWHCFLFSSLVIGLTVLVNQNHQEEYNQSRPLGIPFFFHSYRAIRHIIYS